MKQEWSLVEVKQDVQQFIECESAGGGVSEANSGNGQLRAGGFWRCRPEIWAFLGFFPEAMKILAPPVGRQPSSTPLHQPGESEAGIPEICSEIQPSEFHWLCVGHATAFSSEDIAEVGPRY